MVEGTPLLRAHPGKTWIEGSNPSLSASKSEPFLVKGFFFGGMPAPRGLPGNTVFPVPGLKPKFHVLPATFSAGNVGIAAGYSGWPATRR